MPPTTRTEGPEGFGWGPYDAGMFYVASSGKSTEVSVRVPLWRVKRTYGPAGAIHACAEGEYAAACGVPLALLIPWPERDFASHGLPHTCPNCAVALAHADERRVAPDGFNVPAARRAADDLASDSDRGR